MLRKISAGEQHQADSSMGVSPMSSRLRARTIPAPFRPIETGRSFSIIAHPMKQPIRVAVTGAAGQIGYALLFRIASGQMFGPDQPVILQLLEVPVEKVDERAQGRGDGAGRLRVPAAAGHGADRATRTSASRTRTGACSSAPSRAGRAWSGPTCSRTTARSSSSRARSSTASPRTTARVAVVGNPANTNCMIAASVAQRLPPERFTAMVRLDQNRAATQLAKKAGVPVTDVSATSSSSATTARRCSARSTSPRSTASRSPRRSATHEWLQGELQETVGKRGAAIIAARGASSAASAANALVDHVRDLVTPGKIHSRRRQDPTANTASTPNVWAGMPVKTTTPGSYEVIKGLPMDDFAKQKIAATNKELVEERDAVKGMLKYDQARARAMRGTATCESEAAGRVVPGRMIAQGRPRHGKAKAILPSLDRAADVNAADADGRGLGEEQGCAVARWRSAACTAEGGRAPPPNDALDLADGEMRQRRVRPVPQLEADG